MTTHQSKADDFFEGIKTIQQAKSENEVTRPLMKDATQKDILQATCSCVNHLCGCK